MSDGGPTEPQGPPGREPDQVPSPVLTQANRTSRRMVVAALAALLVLGSCGIAVGVYRATRGGGETRVTLPSPGPGSPSPSPTTSPSPSPTVGVDLVVVDLTGTRVEVANVGTVAAGRFVVSVGGRAFIVQGGLDAGATVAFGYACAEGPLTAVADSTGRVEEADETNNALTAGPFDCASPSPTVSPTISPTVGPTESPSPTVSPTTEPRLPDLVVRQVTSERVVVGNRGRAAAGPFVVDAGAAGTFTVNGLAAGANLALTYPCTAGIITVTVDANDDVVESDERNNGGKGGPFECLPDLIIVQITRDTVTIANQGVGDAGPSVLSLNGQTFNVPGVRAGDRVTVSYPCFGGQIDGVVDVFDDVVESNEANNSLRVDVGIC